MKMFTVGIAQIVNVTKLFIKATKMTDLILFIFYIIS